ncbi:hypothetical protein GY45DRAFT_1410608 [Cubamyces sp. BRFM 1775]|nr:hypothetical protein GY45DRAFT_1410608 [Cubamyces sp. BRFM 1775]
MYPTCPDCLEVYPESVKADMDARCAVCGHALFKIEETPPGRTSRRRGGRPGHKPYLRTPARSLAEQLADLVKEPGMEEALTSWRKRVRLPGILNDFFDGAISRELLGPDGKPFFRHDLDEDPDGELRIGVALGPAMWSSQKTWARFVLTSNNRYRAGNLLLSMIIPGPKESDPDQTQWFVRVLVNELIGLWRDGVVLPTYTHPNGRRIRVILVGVFCDKPAAHKLGGFGSHTHTFFCTHDWISQGQKATKEAFTPNGFRARTDKHHRMLMEEYRQATTKSAREEHASMYATRWSELARLPYFDMCRMVVVDPMHNLFLGTLLYLTLPSRLGRLPRLIGEPAGGSLTADQWLILVTVVGPLALPELWEGIPADTNDSDFFRERVETIRRHIIQRKTMRKGKKASNTTSKDQSALGSATEPRRSTRVRKPTEKAKELVLDDDDAGAYLDEDDEVWDDENEDNEAGDGSRLRARDLATFLKLCAALRLFLSDTITDEQLERADRLLREYCIEIIELYGEDIIRPNHHYATHTAEFVRDYGPLRGFWTFIFERLNKILKSFRTNNHEGGEIEATFFREFYRAARLHGMLAEGLKYPNDSVFHQTCRLMQDVTADGRGTLQQLAEDLEDMYIDDNVLLSFSPCSSREPMDRQVYYAFLTYMQARYPLQSFRSDLSLGRSPESTMLVDMATVFDYVVIAGYRYYAASRSAHMANCLALIRVSEAGRTWVGRIEHIVQYERPSVQGREMFAYVRWLRPAPNGVSLAESPWAQWCVLFLSYLIHSN